jgi:viologen exporter family transport system permease protein
VSDQRRSPLAAGRALAHAFGLGWREAWEHRSALVGMVLMYAVVVSLWASLYRLLPAATLARFSLTYEQIVWYLALTELVAFSIGHAYRQIKDEIKDGGVTAYLVRPVGYVALTAAEELGQMIAKIGALAAPGAALAYVLTGTVPYGVAAVFPVAASLAMGAAVLLAAQILIGLSTAWLGTARPFFFVVQKLMFVLGGLLLPLQAYPAAIVRIAWLTPFPAMLYAPGSFALDPTAADIAAMLALQAFWLGVFWLAIAWVGSAFERRFIRGGLAS